MFLFESNISSALVIYPLSTKKQNGRKKTKQKRNKQTNKTSFFLRDSWSLAQGLPKLTNGPGSSLVSSELPTPMKTNMRFDLPTFSSLASLALLLGFVSLSTRVVTGASLATSWSSGSPPTAACGLEPLLLEAVRCEGRIFPSD